MPLVSGDDDLGFGGDRAGEDVIVVRSRLTGAGSGSGVTTSARRS